LVDWSIVAITGNKMPPRDPDDDDDAEDEDAEDERTRNQRSSENPTNSPQHLRELRMQLV
jgi:hypothetical protein